MPQPSDKLFSCDTLGNGVCRKRSRGATVEAARVRVFPGAAAPARGASLQIIVNMKFVVGFSLFLSTHFLAVASHAQQVIEARLDRTTADGPVQIRGLLNMAPRPNGKLLVLFPGWPGNPRIELKDGKPSYMYLQEHFEEIRPQLEAAGISTMTADCPTDQWGRWGATPSACNDHYRSSAQHADDVRALLRAVKAAHPIQAVYLMGHSYGGVSSQWLATRMSDEVAGFIHSSVVSWRPPGTPFQDYGSSIPRLQPKDFPGNSVFLHHKDDMCRDTPYEHPQRMAPDRLMTVVGGSRAGAPCGKSSYHGFNQRRAEVGAALVKWINQGQLTPVIGAPD